MTILSYLYAGAILFGLFATVRVCYDYFNNKAPNWLTISFVFLFSMLTTMIILDAYRNLF